MNLCECVIIQCDLQMLLNVVVVVVVCRCHCRHNGDSFDPLIWFCVMAIIIRYDERRHQDHDHDAWMIEIYHCDYTNTTRLQNFLNQWICKLYTFLTHVLCPMNEQKADLLHFFPPSSSATTKIHFMGNETCTTIYMQQNTVYWLGEREERNASSMFISFLSCTLTLYLQCSTHLLYYCCCFVFCFFRLVLNA